MTSKQAQIILVLVLVTSSIALILSIIPYVKKCWFHHLDERKKELRRKDESLDDQEIAPNRTEAKLSSLIVQTLSAFLGQNMITQIRMDKLAASPESDEDSEGYLIPTIPSEGYPLKPQTSCQVQVKHDEKQFQFR